MKHLFGEPYARYKKTSMKGGPGFAPGRDGIRIVISRIAKRLIKGTASCLVVISLAGCMVVEGGIKGNALQSNAKSDNSTKDPLHYLQYYFTTMNVTEAWKLSKGIPECLIGIAESDIDESHPELKNKIQEVFRVPGVAHSADAKATAHGTMVTGLMVAEEGNGLGIKGLSPGCNVIVALYGKPKSRIPEKHVRDKLMSEKMSRTIRFLVDRGCKVINCSYIGGPGLQDAYEYAVGNDVVVVKSAGNDNRQTTLDYVPEEVLVVGTIGRDNKRWKEAFSFLGRKPKGSNFGQHLDVVAPTESVVVCCPVSGSHIGVNKKKGSGFKIQRMPSTSLAAPMTTSLVALVRSLRPDLDAKTVVELVKQGADDLGETAWDKYTGYGKLNYYKTLKLAESWPALSTSKG